jgi:hypothetical protein
MLLALIQNILLITNIKLKLLLSLCHLYAFMSFILAIQFITFCDLVDLEVYNVSFY